MITHGFSKDHRPDLKQLVHSLLCVDHGIPIYSQMLDGNASDKNINRDLIPEMVKRMRTLGREDFISLSMPHFSSLPDVLKPSGSCSSLPC